MMAAVFLKDKINHLIENNKEFCYFETPKSIIHL